MLKNIKKAIYIRCHGKNGVVEWFRKKGVRIGEGCEINPLTHFGTEPYLISIGNNVRITGDVKFFTHDGGMWVIRNLHPEYTMADKIGAIHVGDNVSFGWGATVLPNVRIGNNIIIGAGSIVTKDIPDNCVVAGVPARIICTLDEYLQKNKEGFVYTKGMDPAKKRQLIEESKLLNDVLHR